MARFDVYRNPLASERGIIPFYVDVQNTYLDASGTRVVIPMRAAHASAGQLGDLNPDLLVNGDSVILDTAQIGAVPLKALGAKVCNISEHQNLIQLAMDKLFGGY